MANRPSRLQELPSGRAPKEPDDTRSNKREFKRSSAGDAPPKHDADRDRKNERRHRHLTEPGIGGAPSPQKDSSDPNTDDDDEEEEEEEEEEEYDNGANAARVEQSPRIAMPSKQHIGEYIAADCEIILGMLGRELPIDFASAKSDALRQAKDAARTKSRRRAISELIKYDLLSSLQKKPDLEAKDVLNKTALLPMITRLEQLCWQELLAGVSEGSASVRTTESATPALSHRPRVPNAMPAARVSFSSNAVSDTRHATSQPYIGPISRIPPVPKSPPPATGLGQSAFQLQPIDSISVLQVTEDLRHANFSSTVPQRNLLPGPGSGISFQAPFQLGGSVPTASSRHRHYETASGQLPPGAKPRSEIEDSSSSEDVATQPVTTTNRAKVSNRHGQPNLGPRPDKQKKRRP